MNILNSIGHTPLVELRNTHFSTKSRIFAKIESKNPSFSVKDRAAYFMIKDAIDKGILKKGMQIIEPTSGNTGIALAMIGKAMGFGVNLIMPESMSKERIALMKILDANVILTSADKGMIGSITKAKELLNTDSNLFMPDQFNNESNPKAHELTTGPEIFADLNENIDVFVSAVGTGGTVTGVSRFLKRMKKDILTVAVEPQKSPAIGSFLNKKEYTPKPHLIQGIGAGFIPKTLDLSVIDRLENVDDDEAIEFSRFLAKNEGILGGISTGANFAVANRLACEFKDKNIVFIVCDSAERYISTNLFKE